MMTQCGPAGFGLTQFKVPGSKFNVGIAFINLEL
jgi:hypothetical protein